MAITYFPVTGNWAGFPQGSALNGSVTFTPNLPLGSVALDTSHSPPLGEVSATTQAVIVNGVLLATPSGGTVELLANTADLNLDGTLQYLVYFGPVVVDGQPVPMGGFTFDAPTDTTPVDLITVTPAGETSLNWVPQMPVSGLSNATPFSRGFLTGADNQADARVYLGIPGGGGEWESYANLAAFPVTGNTELEYEANDTGKLYRWNGSAYIQIADKNAVGLGNVDNTSDVNKPVSTAQQAAFVAKYPVPQVSQPVVCFTFDDAYTEDFTVVKPILDAQGIKAGFPFPTGFPGGAGRMSWANAVTLYTDGHEILAHSVDHAHMTDATSSLTEAQKRTEVDTRAIFASHGITVRGFAYTFGEHDAPLRRIVRDYFDYGLAILGGGASGSQAPLSTYAIRRVALDDTTVTATHTAAIDTAIANGEILVFLIHSGSGTFTSGGGGIARLNDVIDYAQAHSVPILTPGQAYALVHNTVDFGDYPNGSNSLVIDTAGNTYTGTGTRLADSTSAIGTLPSAYPAGLTFQNVIATASPVTPRSDNGPGLLVTTIMRAGIGDATTNMNHQDFYGTNGFGHWVRYAGVSNGSWGSWLSNLVIDTASTASSATPTPFNTNGFDFQLNVTALANSATFAAPQASVPADGQIVVVRVKDAGTAQSLAFNSIYRFPAGFPAPTVTVASQILTMVFRYNGADSKWDYSGGTLPPAPQVLAASTSAIGTVPSAYLAGITLQNVIATASPVTPRSDNGPGLLVTTISVAGSSGITTGQWNHQDFYGTNDFGHWTRNGTSDNTAWQSWSTVTTVTTAESVSSANPTPFNPNGHDFQRNLSALAVAATLAAPAASVPMDGQEVTWRIEDNGTSQALTFDAIYRFPSGVPAPTATVPSQVLYMVFRYNATDVKWDYVAGTLPPAGSFGFPYTVDPGIVRSSDQKAGPSSNGAVYMRVVGAGTISKIGLQVVASSGNISVGVHRNSGVGRSAVPGSRVATSGAVACPAIGYAEVSLGASVAVSVGDWLSLSVDNVTATFLSLLGAAADTGLGNGRQYRQATAHPVPSTPSGLVAAVGYTFVLVGVT